MTETNQPDIATEVWVNSTAAYPKLVKDGKVMTLTKVLFDGGEEILVGIECRRSKAASPMGRVWAPVFVSSNLKQR